ncbi:MAG: peptide-methionine (R)-S-oxide reductase MsrB [Eubacteriales bacterium]|nr:peptide-methionine (R)-S-oxide reductase MsrB [Eubacteriales bacterium]
MEQASAYTADQNQEHQRALLSASGLTSKAEIYLAGGCFWGVEAYFKQIYGVLETEVGYANGETLKTSYEELKLTGHAETLKLVYDPHKLHLAEILERYYRIVDPFSHNVQGNDYGTQYRTGIFYTDERSKLLAEFSLANFAQIQGREPAILLQPLANFILAEGYHQDYLDKNPGGYCHVNLSKAQDPLFPGKPLPADKDVAKELSEIAYKVMRQHGTEAPYSSPLDQQFTEGIYVEQLTGRPLFSSRDKYDAGCGWPSFTMPITTDVALYYRDLSFGYDRVEVRTPSDNHLGHVFSDGPREAGALRYCINGAALRFIPWEEMEMDYAALKPFVFEPRL